MIIQPFILLATMLASPVEASLLNAESDDPELGSSFSRPDFPPADALIVEPPLAFQVRIEQRIIIRVPRRVTARIPLSEAPRRVEPQRQEFRRKRFGSCLAMNDIAGVQVMPDDRLVLFLRDRRLMEAELERNCRAREFYEGFYMERSEDGRLCADRDLLQARSGSKCEIEDLHQLVPVDPD